MEQNSSKSGTSKHRLNTAISTNASATLAALVSTAIKASENSTCDKSKTNNKSEHSTLACSSVNSSDPCTGPHTDMEVTTKRNGTRKKCNREAVVQSSVTNSTATQTSSCASSSHTCTYPVVANNIMSTTVISGATSTTTTSTCKKSSIASPGIPGNSNINNHLLANCTDNNGSDIPSVKSPKTMKNTPILRAGSSTTVTTRTKRTSPPSPSFPTSVVVGGGGAAGAGGHNNTHSTSIFGPADISTSDDDEISEVESFFLGQEIEDTEAPMLEAAKFLIPAENIEGANLQTVDPETHARLEALLEVAGIGKLSTSDGKVLTDPDVLKKLTSSVSCALDEAAAALHRMKAEQPGESTSEEGSRSLAEACSDGDVSAVRKMLQEGSSVHETTEEGESLLSLACSAGYYELAQVLLVMKANVEDRGIKGDCTPLMEASSGGFVDIAKLLITHGADVNAQSSAGNTPLHYAACGGFEDVVMVLIEFGANVEVHNENGHTPLMEAASAGHVGVAKILLDAGAGINTHSNEFKESALTLACYKGHLEMVRFLLEAGADQEHKTDEMHTALMEASMDGHVEVAKLLLDSGAQVNMPADSFESPLTLAACGGHVELANLLIERGANLEEVNDEGYTPLMEAAREGHEEMVALLLAHGADINAQTEETQETALTLACCGGFLEVADFLSKAGADIELGCSTPLMEAAQEGHLDLVSYLLSNDANVHAQTATGDTALTYACENGHTDVAEILLRANAKLEHESEGGRTPLMKAARAGHQCTVQFLINKGANVNRQTSTNDHTVLSLACAGGHLEVVELLLNSGANLTHRLKDGSTMIIEAAKGGHTAVVSLLLEFPNRFMHSAPEYSQPTQDVNLNTEHRVPVHGLGNIVPPNDPDSGAMNANGYVSGLPECEVPGSNASLELSQPRQTIQRMSVQQQQQQQQQQLQLHMMPQEQILQLFSQSTLSQPQPPPPPQQQAPPQQQQLQLPPQQIHPPAQQVSSPPPPPPVQPQSQQVLATSIQQGGAPTVALSTGASVQSVAQHYYLTQHQQTQLLQQQLLQQQQAHLIQQQLQVSQPNMPKVRWKRHIPNNHQNLPAPNSVGLETVPAPSTTPLTPTASPGVPHLQRYLSQHIDLDAQTDSNHDTALTLACTAGYSDLVRLLLSKTADIEHRDKKGFTPLILAATAGHVEVVEILLDHNAEIEAQSERTKDTPLSLACSGGKFDVVELLLSRVANKEHRNVSDYTPLSLAASGGYVNIIKLLLSNGAEINSRTGSKLGISPLMLAAMNGHSAAVKLLLDMGSDINAQIETNKNTALTLACFQGRHEVVSLLVDRKANIEHRAKTGLTPLMEAASGGYVEVGKVLLDKGADVNAAPVPSSRDTALTIAADKGHYRFVELLLSRNAAVDVKNKKGNSPLWLACNGGHLDVVQLLVSHRADIDSDDNRKVSCLVAAFRKGHIKVVKWMVKYVTQFPLDNELQRYISTVTDPELNKKCRQCMDAIISAKDRQAAEANKNATILLEELDKERQWEENKRAAAAKRRERKKKKKKEKLEKERESNNKSSSPVPETNSTPKGEEEEEEEDVLVLLEPPSATTTTTIGTISNCAMSEPKIKRYRNHQAKVITCQTSNSNINHELRKTKKGKNKVKDKPPDSRLTKLSNTSTVAIGSSATASQTTSTVTTSVSNMNGNKESEVRSTSSGSTGGSSSSGGGGNGGSSSSSGGGGVGGNTNNSNNSKKKKREHVNNSGSSNKKSTIGDLDDFGSLLEIPYKVYGPEIDKLLTKSLDKKSIVECHEHLGLLLDKNTNSSDRTVNLMKAHNVNMSPKRGQKKEDGWKEVVRKSKKIIVSANAISRVIGRGGANINAIRDASGAHIEVEKQKGSGDRLITIKGSAEATRQAHLLINALVSDPDKEIAEILPKNKLSRQNQQHSQQSNHVPSQNQLGSEWTNSSVVSTSSNSDSCNINHVSNSTVASSTYVSTSPSVSNYSSNNKVQRTAISKQQPSNQAASAAGNAVPRTSAQNSGTVQSQVWSNAQSTSTLNSPQHNSLPSQKSTSLSNVSQQQQSQPHPQVQIWFPPTSSASEGKVVRQLFPSDKRTTTTVTTLVTTTHATVTYSSAPSGMKLITSTAASTVKVETHSSNSSPQMKPTITPSSKVNYRPPPPSLKPLDMLCGSSGGVTIGNIGGGGSSSNGGGSSNTSSGSGGIAPNPVGPPTAPSIVNSNLVMRTGGSNVLPQSQLSSEAASIPVSLPCDYSPFNNLFSHVAEQVMGKKDDHCGERMNFASVAAGTQINSGLPSQVGRSSPKPLPAEPKIDAALQAKAPGYKPNGHRTNSPQHTLVSDLEQVKVPNYKNPFGLSLHNSSDVMLNSVGCSLSPRSNNSAQQPGLSPRTIRTVVTLEAAHQRMLPPVMSNQKEEYTIPNQPMTLPKIDSILNPLAPDFKSVSTPQGNLPAQFLSRTGVGNLNSGNIQTAMYATHALNATFVNPNYNSMHPQANYLPVAPPPPPPMPDMQPSYNILTQFNNQPNTNMINPNQPVQRPYSPMHPQVRPNSAQSIALLTKGVQGPSSPLPLSTTPPPQPLEQPKNMMDERKLLKPIGGERMIKKPQGINMEADFSPMIWALSSELNSEWPASSSPIMASAAMSTPVMTSSTGSTGIMTPTVTGPNEGRVPSRLESATIRGNLLEGKRPDQVGQSYHGNPHMLMHRFSNGIAPFNPPPPPPPPQMPLYAVPPSAKELWSMKNPVTDVNEKGNWNSWNQPNAM